MKFDFKEKWEFGWNKIFILKKETVVKSSVGLYYIDFYNTRISIKKKS